MGSNKRRIKMEGDIHRGSSDKWIASVYKKLQGG